MSIRFPSVINKIMCVWGYVTFFLAIVLIIFGLRSCLGTKDKVVTSLSVSEAQEVLANSMVPWLWKEKVKKVIFVLEKEYVPFKGDSLFLKLYIFEIEPPESSSEIFRWERGPIKNSILREALQRPPAADSSVDESHFPWKSWVESDVCYFYFKKVVFTGRSVEESSVWVYEPVRYMLYFMDIK